MTETMRALIGGAGPDWEVRELDVPTPGPEQILIRVHAAGVNRADLYMLEGSYNPNTKTSNVFTAGLEMVGEVAAVGAGVANLAVGGAGLGGFASYAVLDHRHAISMPDTLSWAEAASLPVALATENDALVTQGGFLPGQSVLILGATSAIGLVGVQLAKALGASQVIATTTSAAKESTLTALGADVVVDTKTDNLSEAVNRATNGVGVDIVLDHLGGQPLADSLTATKLRGNIINIGRLAGTEATLDLDALSFRRIRLQGTTFSVRTPEERGEVCAALNAEVMPAVADGRIRPVIDRVFGFDEAKAVREYMRSYQATGKVVIEIP